MKTDPKLRQYTSPSLKEPSELRKENKKNPNNINLPDGKYIRFTWQFKYLGSVISPELNKNAEITHRIKKG
jgi:hypothetical protein